MSKYSTVLAHLLPFLPLLACLLFVFLGKRRLVNLSIRNSSCFFFSAAFLALFLLNTWLSAKYTEDLRVVKPVISIEGVEIRVKFMFLNFKHRDGVVSG